MNDQAPIDPIPFVPDLTLEPEVTAFFDQATNTVSYVVKDPKSNACAVFDSVMDIDYAAGRIAYRAADEIIRFIRERSLDLQWLIETHVHADHLSAAPYIQGKLGGRIGIGGKITVVQETFGKVFNEGTDFQRDGSQFDRLFEDGDKLRDRDDDRSCDAHARSHSGLHDPCRRQRRVRRRHAVHAGRGFGARRLPGRRCPCPLPLDPPAAGAS